MSQEGGNDPGSSGDPGGARNDQASSVSPSYDLFGNQLMPAAPDAVRSGGGIKPDIDRSTINISSNVSTASAGGGQSPPVMLIVAAVAAVVVMLVAGLALYLGRDSDFVKKLAFWNQPKAAAPMIKAADRDLSANEVFKHCMPSIVMVTANYKGYKMKVKGGTLTDLEGEDLLFTKDDKGNYTFYDKDNKPTKEVAAFMTVDGKRLVAVVKFIDNTPVMILVNMADKTPVMVHGKPLIVSGLEWGNYAAGATGSGFFVRPDIVATNFHVVSQGTIGGAAFDGGYVQVTDKEAKYDIIGKPIAVDAYHDLALLYVPGTGAPPIALHPDLSDLKVGQPVYALGSPRGYSGSLSEGVLASDRLRADIRHPDGERFHIQHSAKIDHGNSGGPLVNARGEVIGVNTLGIGTVYLSIAEKKVDELLDKPEVQEKIAALRKDQQADLTGK